MELAPCRKFANFMIYVIAIAGTGCLVLSIYKDNYIYALLSVLLLCVLVSVHITNQFGMKTDAALDDMESRIKKAREILAIDEWRKTKIKRG